MTLVMRYAARSDVGLIRGRNEDSAYAGPDLLVVADGMGGHAAGELASASAVATFASLGAPWAHGGETRDRLAASLGEGVQRATAAIGTCVEDDPDLQGMGTTLTAVAWADGTIGLAHVGDSRGYLLRHGELAQITHDHTYVQMLVDTGRITSDEAAVHSRRNLLMRAIDGVHPVEPDVEIREALAGDRYLLCSDGLSGVVPFDELARLLGAGDPTYAVTALVERALELGAPDNVTAVVADVVDVSLDGAAAVESGAPVVVGAAGERRVREQLPSLVFPDDAEPDPESLPPTRATEPVELPGTDADGTEVAGVTATRRRRPRTRSVVAVTLAVVALALITTGGLLWARSQYFVAANEGYVAIYRGLPATVGGVALSSVADRSTLAVTALPTLWQEQLERTMPASGLDDARSIVANLERTANECVTSPTTGCPGWTPSTATTTAPGSGSTSSSPPIVPVLTPSGSGAVATTAAPVAP